MYKHDGDGSRSLGHRSREGVGDVGQDDLEGRKGTHREEELFE
jgi:hypothetical protein